jgi:hypothetical protein
MHKSGNIKKHQKIIQEKLTVKENNNKQYKDSSNITE